MESILTVTEVAKYFKVKPLTIYKWVEKRVLPAIKLGKTLRFKRESIEEFIDKRKIVNVNSSKIKLYENTDQEKKLMIKEALNKYAGIWKNRKDIKDVTEYVRRIREKFEVEIKNG